MNKSGNTKKVPSKQTKTLLPLTEPQLEQPEQHEQSSYRTEQEIEAEARQTQLDLEFVLLLSEDPE